MTSHSMFKILRDSMGQYLFVWWFRIKRSLYAWASRCTGRGFCSSLKSTIWWSWTRSTCTSPLFNFELSWWASLANVESILQKLTFLGGIWEMVQLIWDLRVNEILSSCLLLFDWSITKLIKTLLQSFSCLCQVSFISIGSYGFHPPLLE